VPLKRHGYQTNPKNVMSSGNTQQEIFARAAEKYQLSPETLWGIYGTESAYGTNDGPSSAGAEGPMQFEPATAREYGLTSGANGTVQQLGSAVMAAARYLHDLGADRSPSSAKTISAVNAYNGNGGGSNPATSYAQSVLSKGKTYGGSTRTSSASEQQGSPPATQDASLLSSGGSLLSLGQDLLTGNIADLGGKLALASLSVIKGVGLGFADLVIAPAWHWNQRATAYYAGYALSPRNIGNGTPFQWAFAWTAGFWGVGYVLLWTETESGSLKPVAVRHSRAAHRIRKLQALPARKSLIKPSKVKENTPKKPKPAASKATVTLQSTFSTTRPRQVKVQYDTNTGGDRSNTSTVPASVPVEQVGTTQAEAGNAEPHAHNPAGKGASSDKRGDTSHPPKAGSTGGDRA
jgi:hypothetical protein